MRGTWRMLSDMESTGKDIRSASPDKLNRVEFHWFVVRALPRQEKKLAALLSACQPDIPNILEVYCPTRTTVDAGSRSKEAHAPLFAGYVFVLSTQQALVDFMHRHYPEGTILYDRRKQPGRKAAFLTIPEQQIRFFKDFNENYADQAIILERPYTSYAFNPKTHEPNEIVKVLDGPLKGREGYLTRFRRGRSLVFNMKTLGTGHYFAVSIPDIWNFPVVRLHNAEGDRQTLGTVKERAVDLLIGMLQACGYADRTLSMLSQVIDLLVSKPLLADLCRTLTAQGHAGLAHRIAGLDTAEAELLLNLVRYERDNPGYVRSHAPRLTLRPFLTPTSGVPVEEGSGEARLAHAAFTEIIRRVRVTEPAYYPSRGQEASLTTTYYAHIGSLRTPDGYTLFANWDAFLAEYLLTRDKANERLVHGTSQADSFRNFAPTFYRVLADPCSSVQVCPRFRVGDETLNVLAIQSVDDAGPALDRLVDTCVRICQEINATTHLAVWRRYLRSVWLHS